MTDETIKSNNKRLLSKVVGRTSSGMEPKKSVFDKIKSLVPFFNPREKKEATLVGRIHAELQKDAHEMLNEIKCLKDALKKELEKHDEGHLWNSFEAVVNPLMREYAQIERKLKAQYDSLDTNTTAIKSYNDWIIKAKLWVTLCSRPSDREGLIKVVVAHTMQVSDDIIDRDLKTLHDYKVHELHQLKLIPDELQDISRKLEQEMEPHILALQKLKHNKPLDMKLENLTEWKGAIDESRTKHYNTALHIIDNLVNSIAPVPLKEEEQEHLKEIFESVAYLEEEVPIFKGHLQHADFSDITECLMLEGQLSFLEEEVHKLNRDLRLTPELIDRVTTLIHELTQARKYFQQAQGSQ